jgi:hypothetical protein
MSENRDPVDEVKPAVEADARSRRDDQLVLDELDQRLGGEMSGRGDWRGTDDRRSRRRRRELEEMPVRAVGTIPPRAGNAPTPPAGEPAASRPALEPMSQGKPGLARPRQRSLGRRLLQRAGWAIEKRLPWHRLPRALGLIDLVAIRARLQQHNLHDTGVLPSAAPDQPAWRPEYASSRSPDGTYNDVENPRMGAASERFGRNVALDRIAAPSPAELLSPSPREISRRLLTRGRFVAAERLNVLAAAWVQFEVHDWFSHGEPDQDRPHLLPLEPDDPWHERPMKIGRTPPDPTRPPVGDGGPPTYLNRVTHWWDASQLYGSSRAVQMRLRSGRDGKLLLTDGGELPIDLDSGLPLTGWNENWWLGLHLLHSLFAREHNAICDRLRADYPRWTDEQLFGRARLVNAALIAKIHTLEWADAILGHPTMKHALRDNWWGFAGERARRLLGRLDEGSLVSGVPGSPRDHHAVPYSITEEFVAVYRMHPLLPDDFRFRSAATGDEIESRQLTELVGQASSRAAERMAAADLFYSFGLANAGALCLNNYPVALQNHRGRDGSLVDVGAIDILRDRERGVPRYNALRRALGLPPAADFDQLCDDPSLAAEVRAIYGGDIEKVDLLIGLLAERSPDGFSLSDTAFRIFLLMASRRLESDRFFTTDYTPEYYTPAGLAWIDENSMSTVLLRHIPDLAPALRHVENPFSPWPTLSR